MEVRCQPRPVSLEFLPSGDYYVSCACGWWRSAPKSKRIAKKEFQLHRRLALGVPS